MALGAAWSLGLGAAILGAILVHVASVLDGVDGEITRLQVRASSWGVLLDGVFDRLANAAVIAGLAVWAFEDGGRPTLTVLLAVAATAGSILSMASKDRVAALRIPPAPELRIGFLLGGRDARLLLVAIAGWRYSPTPAPSSSHQDQLVRAETQVANRAHAIRERPPRLRAGATQPPGRGA